MPSLLDHNAALPTGYLPTADQVIVTINHEPVRVVRYSHFDVPLYFVHVSLPEGSDHDVRVQVKRHHNTWSLHPARLGIAVVPDQRALRFTVRDHPHLVFECDGLGYLMLAFDPPQDVPAGPGVLSAEALGIVPDASRVQTAAIQAALDRVSTTPELHTLVLPPGLYRAGDLRLPSDCRLHLASGAVLKASDRADDMGDPRLGGWDPQRACFIHAHDARHLAITGHGHIDGNRAVLDLQRYYKGLVRLVGCQHVLLDGPVLSDPCNWNTTLRNCQDVLARRLKVLNNRPLINCINTDGINPDGSSRVTIEHCLMHTGDDAVAVKSSLRGDDLPNNVADITVTDLLAINNSTTAKIGTETCAKVMERISFRRIDAVRTARLCGIDAFDEAHIHDVVFEDCHVHHLDDRRGDRRVIDLHAPAEAWRSIGGKSRISNVTLRNISSSEPGRCVLTGRDAEYSVKDVRFFNVTVAGREVTRDDLACNAFVSGVAVAESAGAR